ncbi:MAG: ribonuclease catalytic domain-containing protein [Spirochaetaceae bacterium]|jgi:exoribonuclease-2|nr:ribonuclease catalytic domain-containing protein [Spirochaetaceae bacterium]
MIQPKALVLYKQSPAQVASMDGDKIIINVQSGTKKVRPKDISLLHPGPLNSLADLEVMEGAPEEAWELFQGEAPLAEDLAELIYGEFSPSSAWSIYLLLNRTPWFKGTFDKIEVSTHEEREVREKADREKKEAKDKLESFKARLAKEEFIQEDQVFLDELKQQALGLQKKSAILKQLKKEQTPQNAHRLLLKWGIVEPRWNPFPLRSQLDLSAPQFPMEPLPQEERIDLTHTLSYAIDDEGSRDPDDAIAWDGEYFWVHIADAAAVVSPGSKADLAAQQRAANLYLPEGTIPMLPQEVTENLALGLREEGSPAVSFRFKLNESGQVEQGDMMLSWIKVKRISYQKCHEFMDQSPYKEMFQLMSAFQKYRIEQGALQIQMPEVKTRVDEKGKIHITALPSLDSREMVANAMMLTGGWVASFCLKQKISIPYASQPSPDNPPPQGKHLSDMLACRKLMQRSRVSLAPGRHSGLGLDVYTRATSPLRRYSDLLVMQQLRRHLKGEKPMDEDELTMALALFEAQATQVTVAERQSNIHWKLIYLQEQPNWQAEAVLGDQNERQGHFVIPSLALETRIPMKQKKELNSMVILSVKSVDIVENTAQFKIEKWLD